MNNADSKIVEMHVVEHENERFYKISNNDLMRPFFMNIVSDANHWMFISSNGGLSAGRKNPDYALFPYYTDDKITEGADITGSKSIFRIKKEETTLVWEPFTERFNDKYTISRNLYKNLYGNKIMFEEILHDLGLVFRYQWNSSNKFGFVRKVELINHSDHDYDITLLDGIQNIMPFGVGSDLQNSTSNLVDAYKRSELVPDSGLGIFALSAIIVDKAEPSEALEANIVWSLGLQNSVHLLSSLQLPAFRKSLKIQNESDIKGEKGAYFVSKELKLSRNSDVKWKIIANVRQNHAQIISLSQTIQMDQHLEKSIEEDVEAGTQNLIRLNAASDGLQITADDLKDTRHFSNTLFNIMRGGIFDDNYHIEKSDFLQYLDSASKAVKERNSQYLGMLADKFSQAELMDNISSTHDVDFLRLCTEYLPLKFSRRHGDPSRPWNRFSINTQSETDGSKILDYQGNWRDIFQNWEALSHSYPAFIEGMIFKFVNASTFDGYNPYRVTKGGFDWETIEPDNPWSYIGYWGDHQVVYLLKFLEFAEKYHPGELNTFFEKEYFVYANIPYRIKPYADILNDPKNTIDFDSEADHHIRNLVIKKGADGALVGSKKDDIHHVNFMEKMLAMVLSKLSNFIPEGGIWMNTQRPEWNDANNALVGNGVSMVTLYYLKRFFNFFEKVVAQSHEENTLISEELVTFFNKIWQTLESNKHELSGRLDNTIRKVITDALGQAGSEYRHSIYHQGFSGIKAPVSYGNIADFISVTLKYLQHTIEANLRADGLYHAYNLMKMEENGIEVAHLSEMLEGQVAVISSGHLDCKLTLKLLDAMRSSALYREDQNSYLLYPNKALPKFLEKNNIPHTLVHSSSLLVQLVKENNIQIINKDIRGNYHFNGGFKNANDLKHALHTLNPDKYGLLVEKEKASIMQIFEKVFNHIAFTGRSGTFYAYEGLGSIYWHMVSKLHLAVQEVCMKAIHSHEDKDVIRKLISHYEAIGQGIGLHKSPKLYGAFPTDAYSHTPGHRGAQQPGMTGQVKEDVLIRFGELGVNVKDGKLSFEPSLLHRDEFLKEAKTTIYFDVNGIQKNLRLETDSLFFTQCQIPVIYSISDKTQLKIDFHDGHSSVFETPSLDSSMSQKIFRRTNEIKQILVMIDKSSLL
ncbi:MAG: hypothetical protein IPL08_12270 [Saprospiraceae bacterium]|nr:hypothetical protein [Saprospiraceae bacterium]